jgi:diacylglycerol kinase
MADFIHPDYHQQNWLYKDIAAGAVFCGNYIHIGLIIYVPRIF